MKPSATARLIITHRTRLGLSPAEFSERLGVSEAAVLLWEQGHRPHVRLIPRIAKLCGVKEGTLT